MKFKAQYRTDIVRTWGDSGNSGLYKVEFDTVAEAGAAIEKYGSKSSEYRIVDTATGDVPTFVEEAPRAKATKHTPQFVMPPYTVTLELSQAEAETLAAILVKIGGTPKTTRRKHAQAVLSALTELGVSASNNDLPLDSTLWFKEVSKGVEEIDYAG